MLARRARFFILVCLVSAIPIGSALAQGGISATMKGRVIDADGSGLPGVVVQIRSAAQPTGNKAVPTDIEGNYRIPLLPPANDYMISINYPGFAPIELGPIDLDPGKTTVQDISLSSIEETTETIHVEASGNIVDTESTKTASAYNEEFIEGLPIIGTNFQDILILAPGVTDTDGDGNPNVHGARDTGLQIRLDGGNITDPASGTFGQNLNNDIIEELEVITAGASAEFGRADGGFANIITKSGGNDFEGRFSIRFRSMFLNGDVAQDNDVNTFDAPETDYRDVIPVLSLGGAIVRDKLWYFGSLEIVDSERPSAQVGNPRLQTLRGHQGFAKMTWQANSYNKLAFQVSTDPLEFTGNNIALGTSPDSDFIFDQGGITSQVKWTSTISPQLLLESQVSFFNSGIAVSSVSNNFTPTDTALVNSGSNIIQSLYPCQAFNCMPQLGEKRTYQIDLVDGTINGPFNVQTDDERSRNAIRADLSYNIEDSFGQHNIKTGIEFADESFEDNPLNNPLLVDVTEPFQRTVSGGGTDALSPFAITGIQQVTSFDPLVTPQKASSFNSSLFLLDSWKPIPNLTINAGVRLDRENIDTSGYDYFDPQQERRESNALWSTICIEADLQGVTTGASSNCHQFNQAAYNGLPPEILDSQLKMFRDGNGDGVTDVDPAILSLDVNKDGLLQTSGNGPNDEGQQLYRDLTRFRERSTRNFSIENTNISPRFSVSWDPWADGKTKTFGSYGRFYDRLFLDSVTGEIGPDSVNFSFVPDATSHLIIPGALSRATSSVTVAQIDRDLETPYTDEWTLGVERELAAEWSISVTYINRKGTDLLQDNDINHLTCANHTEIGIDPRVICGDGGTLETDRFGDTTAISFGGGGEAIAGGDFGFDPTLGFKLPNGAPDLYTVNNGFNQILRVGNYNSSEFDAWELKLTKRLHHNWQMQFSYTLSEAFGQAEAFADTAGNDPETTDDEEGYLDFDQRHVLKFQAVTRLPHDISLGSSIQWTSGVPWSLTQTVVEVDSTGNTLFRSFFPTGQRNDQRNSGWWKIDGRIEKNFTFSKVQASAFMTVENLLDDQQLTITEEDLTSIDGIPLEAFNDIGRRFEVGAIFNF